MVVRQSATATPTFPPTYCAPPPPGSGGAARVKRAPEGYLGQGVRRGAGLGVERRGGGG